MPEGPASEAPALEVPSHLVHVQRLGAGAYGEVHLYEDTASKDKEKVAVKWIRDFTRDPLTGKRILREVRLMAALRHENLLKLTDLLPPPNPDFDDVCIVMPYMHLDLHKVIYSKMKLSESHSQAFVCQILRGLKYMHSAGVVHRDLKPSNVLVNKDCTLRIADFGLARGRLSEEENLTEYVVTRYYRAPELLLLPWIYFEQVDLWSVGCIHFEILSREPLFRGKDHMDMLKRIASTLGFSADRDLDWVPEKDRLDDRFKKAKEMPAALRLPEVPDRPLRQLLPGASEACLDLISRLLDKVPSSRITASEAIAHEYLAHLHDPAGETVASKVFDWNFDCFEPTKRALKDRMYAECARRHPDIIERDAAWLTQRGYYPGKGTAPLSQGPAAAPRPVARGPIGA
ncbi:unnamed protein product [Prorocentrum cordatum]|uniref:Protein kinase domain-containing protein n=1 Tax=Prorocentrum cordatum TaxID=2364126 RepID=A0ABN9RVX0_9DINO|nr:unnamed protein product [Polarella glacialis]